ncbi:hypothetical protein, partial [Streptomyces sp. HCCB10043]|uniref:hypothetical protein n=1 Tax=Streptomyces sp. HCCB10043 TaxID=1396518 RepID=UPI000516CE11
MRGRPAVPYPLDGGGQAPDGFRHRLVGEVPVADDEGRDRGVRPGGLRRRPVVVQARQAYVVAGRFLHHGVRRAVAQGEQQMESGGRPADG